MKFRVLLLASFAVASIAEASGSAGSPAIIAAAKAGEAEAIRSILAGDPAEVQAVDASGYTALHWAGIRAQWETFMLLAEAGAKVNAVGGDGGTPLHWACHHDRPDMVALLLEKGADPALANQWGRTALHVAARRGCCGVAELLLSRGADPNAMTREGWTPLHVAYKSGHPELVDLLIAKGASEDAKDGDGATPREHLFERPPAVEVRRSRLHDYVGRYEAGEGFAFDVWRVGARLFLREFAPDEIYPIAPDVFFCKQEPWEVRFVRDEAGTVRRIEVDFLRRTVSGVRPEQEFTYVGSQACARCHSGEEHGKQYTRWISSRHGLAYWRLATGWAKLLAAAREDYRDISEPIAEQRCIRCHSTGAGEAGAAFAEAFDPQEGVGCEACHGPGSGYLDPEVMKDRDTFLSRGGRIPNELTCRGCHFVDFVAPGTDCRWEGGGEFAARPSGSRGRTSCDSVIVLSQAPTYETVTESGVESLLKTSDGGSACQGRGVLVDDDSRVA